MFKLFPREEKFFDLFHRQGEAVRRGCEQLHDMFEHYDDLPGRTVRLKQLEHEADAVSRDAVADLFSGRHETLDVLRWKEIYGRLEAATDQCEDVANTIESIVIKSR